KMGQKKRKPRNFAECLGQLFLTSGMTQGEVARRAGVSPQVVSRLLTSGNADVTLSIACRLAWAMGKGVAEFENAVFEEWKMQPDNPILQEISRGRLRQKLEAIRDWIKEWEATAETCGNDLAQQITRRWMEGMIRHKKKQAQQ